MTEENNEKKLKGFGPALTRRGFLTTVGAGAVALAASGNPASRAKATASLPAKDRIEITLQVNGSTHQLLVEARWSLLYVLRDRLGLIGTKPGCERGECGTCTVLIDDVPRYACLTLAVAVAGQEITTVEGLLRGEELGPVQQAFVEEDAFQCGYCTSGQIMAVEGLLRADPHPSPEKIQKELSGNLCRCGSYINIFNAAEKATKLKKG